MKTDNTNYEDSAQVDAQAKQIASLLDDKAQRLSMRTLKQLEDGRNRAIERHKARQGSAVNADGTLSHWLGWAGDHRVVMMGVALAVMLSAFLVLQNLGTNETSDAFLLGADLPPEAFVDKGFEPSLNAAVL